MSDQRFVARSPFLRTQVRYRRIRKIGGPNTAKKARVAPKLLNRPNFHSPLSGTLTWYLPIKINPFNPCMNRYTLGKINSMIRKKMLAYKPKEFKEISLPCSIIIARVAPRRFDYDNLVASMKHVTDTCADMLIPGLAAGRADGDKRLKFHYDQESAGKGEYGVKITISYSPKVEYSLEDHV